MNINTIKDKPLRDRGCLEKHDRICDIIAHEWRERDQDWVVQKEVQYNKPHLTGDYDVYATPVSRPGYLAITEAKSTYCDRNVDKSLQQLKKGKVHAELYLPFEKVFTFLGVDDPQNKGVSLVRVYDHELPNSYEHLLE